MVKIDRIASLPRRRLPEESPRRVPGPAGGHLAAGGGPPPRRARSSAASRQNDPAAASGSDGGRQMEPDHDLDDLEPMLVLSDLDETESWPRPRSRELPRQIVGLRAIPVRPVERVVVVPDG